MSNIYNAQVLGSGSSVDPDATIVQSTSVYADTEIEAKIQAAAQLGVSPDRVHVVLIPGVSNPSDDELRKMWAEGRENQTTNTEITGGGAYG